jgi:hypothetical protein
VEAYDLAHKLAYAGRRSPVPFSTGAEYTNSVPGVPGISMIRIFLAPSDWSRENVILVAREICRVLGSTEQFDVGITQATHAYGSNQPAAGSIARLTKMDPNERMVELRFSTGLQHTIYTARFPQLRFAEDQASESPEFAETAEELASAS